LLGWVSVDGVVVGVGVGCCGWGRGAWWAGGGVVLLWQEIL